MVADFAELCPVKMEDEYKKDSRLKPEVIAEFKRWALSNPNYPRNIPDVTYAMYLSSSKFILEDAKKFFHNNLKVRTEVPELFANRDPLGPHIKSIFELIDVWVSPKATPDGYRILYTGFSCTDPTNYNFAEACKAFLMVGETHVLQTGSNPGLIVVLDAHGGNYRHLLKANMRIINRFLYYVQEAIPVAIVQVHVINIIPLIDKIMFLIKPFIKKALMENIYFHSTDMTEFYKHVPKDILPKELGGEANISRRELKLESEKNVNTLRQWFIEEESLRLISDKDLIKEQKEQRQTIEQETSSSFRSLSFD